MTENRIDRNMFPRICPLPDRLLTAKRSVYLKFFYLQVGPRASCRDFFSPGAKICALNRLQDREV